MRVGKSFPGAPKAKKVLKVSSFGERTHSLEDGQQTSNCLVLEYRNCPANVVQSIPLTYCVGAPLASRFDQNDESRPRCLTPIQQGICSLLKKI